MTTIDLRSDTVTKPTASMREAMARAEVGDDVYGEDPTVKRLEERVAALFGKEAALFVPSGTMGNQLAIVAQTRRGDEVIAGEGAHSAWYESGAGPVIAGVQFAIAGKGGLFSAEDVEASIKPPAYYYPRTSLVCVENTHNRAGGRIFPQKEILRIAETAKKHGLRMHLDGARIWNAHVATGTKLADLAAPFDSVSACFSKGLGAPVGSALVGSREVIREAHVWRKRLGAGMRQVGILAAAALHALDHHVARLADDHARAKRLAEALAKVPGVVCERPDTNIVNVDFPGKRADDVVALAKDRGVLVNATAPSRIRVVFHLDVSDADTTAAIDRLAQAIAAALPAGK